MNHFLQIIPRIKSRFFLFVLIGLLIAVPAEFYVNVIARQSLLEFSKAVAGYLILYLPVFYILSQVINRQVKNPLAIATVGFLAFGAIGLAIEWFFLGNSPLHNSEASQIGMFTYWGSFYLVPLIISDETNGRKFKNLLITYLLLLTVSFTIIGYIFPIAGLFVLIYGYWPLNYFYIRYFILTSKYQTISRSK